MRRSVMAVLLWAAASLGTWAQTTTVFGGHYRIPSLLRLSDSQMVAFCDYRPEGGDVGQSPTLQNNIVAKVFSGGEWGGEQTLLRAGRRGDGRLYSFGDAATAYDEATGRILLVCAYGDVAYWNSTLDDPIGVYRAYFHLSGDTLAMDSCGDITPSVYETFGGKVTKTFFTSGRICQSRMRNPATGLRRLYVSLASNLGARVLFSDDFGGTWQVLGGDDALPAPSGDEAKVAELPNGDVLLSCRARDADGRYLNVFHFSKPLATDGVWESPVLSADTLTGGLHGARCNGELLSMPVRNVQSGRRAYILLQSLPFGTDRSRVGIYYQVSDGGIPSARQLATGWKAFAVSTTHSAYSTMADNGRDGFDLLYEEDLMGPNPDNYNYNIKYRSVSIKDLTGGEYEYYVPQP